MSEPQVDLDRIPEELREWIQAGGEYRADTSEPFAGCCGALVARGNGSGGREGPVQWCQRGAGEGTDHKGFGFCWHHEDHPKDEGLGVWVGPMTEEEWKELTGAGHTQPTHRARQIQVIRRSWVEYLKSTLPPDEVYAYETMGGDPVELIDQAIKINRLQYTRILMWQRRQIEAKKMDAYEVGGLPRDTAFRQSEAKLLAIDNNFARLMEVRARYSEIASAENNQAWLEDALRGMDDEQFIRLSSNHEAFMDHVNRLGRGN